MTTPDDPYRPAAVPATPDARHSQDRPTLCRATIHLTQQTTLTIDADDLWPTDGAYSRFGPDLESFAHELTRRMQTDGYIGFRTASGDISIVPLSAVKRIDVAPPTD